MNKLTGRNIFKFLGSLLLIIIGLWLIRELLFPLGNDFNFGFRSAYRGGHFQMSAGAGNMIGIAGTISFLLFFLIKVLFVLFIIGLVVGLVIYVKKRVFTEEDIIQLKSTFTGKKTVVVKETCSICSRELNDGWKVCPYCGKEK